MALREQFSYNLLACPATSSEKEELHDLYKCGCCSEGWRNVVLAPVTQWLKKLYRIFVRTVMMLLYYPSFKGIYIHYSLCFWPQLSWPVKVVNGTEFWG